MSNHFEVLEAPSKPSITKHEESKIDYYLSGIINNDSIIIEEIYSTFFPVISNLVQKNNGSKEEALDVFQDSLLIILKKILRKDFQLTSSFHTYLYAVCRLVWLKQLKRNKKSWNDMNYSEAIDSNLEQDIDERSKEKLFKSKMELLSPESRKVLELFFNKKSMKEISEIMGYTVEYTKRKKYKAKNKLVELIKADKAFHYFYDEECLAVYA